jgi:hypothetical protein
MLHDRFLPSEMAKFLISSRSLAVSHRIPNSLPTNFYLAFLAESAHPEN